MIGISPPHLLRAEPIERGILLATILEAVKIRERWNHDLANIVIYEYAEAVKRGRKRKS